MPENTIEEFEKRRIEETDTISKALIEHIQEKVEHLNAYDSLIVLYKVAEEINEWINVQELEMGGMDECEEE